jgi:hypothetical protein
VDVFILGAGFSRAISDAMPLVTDLVEPLASHLEGDDATRRYANLLRSGGDLEVLLTYFAEEQPWLDQGATLLLRHAFRRATDWLAEEVFSRQQLTLGTPPPNWLPLVRSWHESRVAVVTLNYDLLVESAAETLERGGDSDGGARLRYMDLVKFDLPRVRNRRQSGAMAFGHDFKPSFKLVKLHGSLNWAHHSDGGEEVWDSEGVDFFESQERKTWGDVKAELRDLQPLIVPPSTGKTRLLTRNWIRAWWVDAAEAIRNARALYVIGYSLPMSDVAVRLLLMTNLSEGSPVVTVNRDADYAGHFAEASAHAVAQAWTGDRCVEEFVASYLAEGSH